MSTYQSIPVVERSVMADAPSELLDNPRRRRGAHFGPLARSQISLESFSLVIESHHHYNKIYHTRDPLTDFYLSPATHSYTHTLRL